MKAFGHTAAYDAMIADWLAREQGERFPDRLVLAGRKRQELRYGENPHQAAAAYASGNARPGVIGAEQLQGKALSYNNLNDTNAAFELVAEFAAPTSRSSSMPIPAAWPAATPSPPPTPRRWPAIR